MQFAFNTVKYISSGWLTIYFLSKWSPADRIFINFSSLYDSHSWKLIDVFSFRVLSSLQPLCYRALDYMCL